MTLPDLYTSVYGFAKARHAGQVREGSGKPYFCHPEAVAATFDLETQPVEKMAAILHDTMEDCGVSRAEIVALAGEDAHFRALMDEVATAVEHLTHQHSPKDASPEQRRNLYREALLRAKSNPHARLVKIADLRDNLSTLDRLPQNRRGELSFKYSGALDVLGAGRDEVGSSPCKG